MSHQPAPVQAEITLLQRHVWIKRRTEARYHCGPATSGRLVIEGGQDSLRAWVINLSRKGAGLLLDRHLAIETFMVIHIKSSSQSKVYELPARVVHCTQQPTGDWLIGCELAEP